MLHLSPTRSNTMAAQKTLAQIGLASLEIIPKGEGSEETEEDDLADLYTTRAVLEELAARQAVQHLTDADIVALEEISHSAHLAQNEGRTEALAELIRELHLTIYRASKRRHLMRVIEELWETSALRALPEPHMVSGDAQANLFAVRSIVSACKLRDGNALGLLVRYKVHQAATHLAEKARAGESEGPKSRVNVRA